MVAPELYWDFETASLVEQPQGSVFYQLFDSEDPNDKVELNSQQVELLKRRQQETYDELIATGDLKERYDFVTTWACGNHDLYMDMLRGHAYCFMAKRPPGAYFLVGPKRNGKSTYVKLITKIVGSANAAKLNLVQLNDPAFNMTLSAALINAPDEIGEVYDNKTRSDFQRNFKILTQHEPITVKKYYSQETATIQTDFLCYFPTNAMPKWSDADVGPCMERSYIIPFYAKLASSDRKTRDFFKETFTPFTLAGYVGTLLGIAAYYTSIGEFEFSPTMLKQQQLQMNAQASATAYMDMFHLFFDGFQNEKLIFRDYGFWCDAHSLKRQTQAEFELVINDYLLADRVKAPSKYGRGISNEQRRKSRPNVQRIPRPNKLLMVEDYNYGHGFGTIQDLHSDLSRRSLVDKLDSYYREVQGDNYDVAIRRQDAASSGSAKNPPELEQARLIEPPRPRGLDDDIFKEGE